MAVTATSGAIADQFAVLAEARWQAFRNSLRRKQKRYELIFKLLFWAAGFTMVCGGGVIFFVATYFLLPRGTTVLAVVFWVLLVAWQFVPIVLEGQSPALDFREIARYPITFRLYYLMSVAYGFFDPVAMTAIFWSFCTWFAILLRRPELALRSAFAFLLFIALNLLMNRVVFAWVARITQTRKGRERLMIASMLFGLLTQFAVYFQPRGGSSAARGRLIRDFLLTAHTFSPPGWAQAIISKGWMASTTALAGFAGVIILLGAILFRQLWRTYCGEIGSEGSRRSGAVQVSPGWSLPGLSETISAVVEKELRYMMKDPKLFMSIIMAWAVCFLMTTGSQFMKDAFRISAQKNSNYILPAMMGYSFLVISPQVFNMFWSDATGFQRWLLSSISMRQVILGKNISMAILVVVNLVVVTGICSLRGPIPLQQLALTVLGAGYIGLFMFGAGNFFSAWFPKKVDPTKVARKNVSEAAGITSMLTMAILGFSWFAVVAASTLLQIPWLPFAALGVLLALGAVFYRYSLGTVPKLVDKGLDKLLAELG